MQGLGGLSSFPLIRLLEGGEDRVSATVENSLPSTS